MNLAKNLPTKPGIYMFKDADSVVLYVGKAINLKSRVSSYFTGKQTDRPWIAVMIGLVKNVETIIVKNELEALLLESSLIKEFKPKFNIKLVDDKSYPFIQLNLDEDFPRFSVTRRRSNKPKVQYFGPYLSARSARITLEFLRNLYGIHISLRPLKASTKPCFYCQLSGNNCVLADEVTIEGYHDAVNSTVEFLKGKRGQIIKDLRARMEQASARQNYEVAAKLRDRLEATEQIRQRQQVVGSLDDFDAIGCYIAGNKATVVVHSIRDGRIIGQKDYEFESLSPIIQRDLVGQFLASYYRTFSQIPTKVFVPVEIAELEVTQNILSDAVGHRVIIAEPERGEKRSMVDLANKNAQAKLEISLLKLGNAAAELIGLQELLKMANFPERIEAIDISNLGTSEAVGACVCFINGQPDKNEYRRYKIKTVEGQNDFAMIREVVSRRLHDTARPAPDVLVIDGGKQQLVFALEGAKNAPTQPKLIIGLAKKPDRVFLPGKKLPLSTPRGHKGLRLLSRIRDEVHRFGINFQRSRQRKKSLEN